jgi:hypothetical protein
MKIVTQRCDLLSFLAQRLAELKPTISVPAGFGEIYARLVREIRKNTTFSVDQDEWVRQLQRDFTSLSRSQISELPEQVIDFINDMYARCIASDVVYVDEAIEVLLQMLKYEGEYFTMRFAKRHRYVESLPKCHNEFNLMVKVQLRDDVVYSFSGRLGSDRRLDYPALWWKSDEEDE